MIKSLKTASEVRRNKLLWLGSGSCVFLALFFLLSWTTFSEDDAHLLRVAATTSWTAPFFDSQAYQQLSAANYTPFLQTFYKTVVTNFGIQSEFFLIVTLLTLMSVVLLTGMLASRLANSSWAAYLVMLLVVSNLELITLATRFYTFHYVLGAVFASGAVVQLCRQELSLQSKLGAAFLLLLALLSKEVYALLLPFCFLLAVVKKDWQLTTLLGLAGVLYAVWRVSILGWPFGVASDSSYATMVWQVDVRTWLGFLHWYFSNRALIWIAVILAFFLNPKLSFRYFGIAMLFLLPVAGAAHGILQPELHADRLFFAFDCTLALGAGVVIANSLQIKATHIQIVLCGLLLIVVALQLIRISSVKQVVAQSADYQITRNIEKNSQNLNAHTLYVPLHFTQGDLQTAFNSLDISTLDITHNCFEALQVKRELLVVFDGVGNRLPSEDLELQCHLFTPDVTVITPPRLRNKVLEWHIEIPDGIVGGVYFKDRNFPVPVSQFSRVLAIPDPHEQVQLFANRGTEWWFSEPMTIPRIDAGSY